MSPTKVCAERNNTGALIPNPQASWQPPSKERLASVDLGPLKSPLASNSSYHSLGRRSSISTYSTNREPNVAELDSREIVHVEQNQARIQRPAKVSFAPLLHNPRTETTIAERRTVYGRSKTKGAGPAHKLQPQPLRKIGKGTRRTSESSDDEIFGQILNSPTVRYGQF